MNIHIHTIPHKSQIYPTVGDWRFQKNGDLKIFISDMMNWKYEFLVAIHELCEVALCKNKGIKQEDVDTFDVEFEKKRSNGLVSFDKEPGDDILSPYRSSHFFATSIERLLAIALEVDWIKYEDAVNNL